MYFMGNHFTLYIKTNCPFCIDAKNELYSKKLSHTLHIMDDNPEGLQELKKFYEHPTVPMVFVNNGTMEKLIGGYTDLCAYLDTLGG